MHVDESRRTIRQRASSRAGPDGANFTQRHDTITADREIAMEPRIAAAIDELAIANDESYGSWSVPCGLGSGPTSNPESPYRKDVSSGTWSVSKARNECRLGKSFFDIVPEWPHKWIRKTAFLCLPWSFGAPGDSIGECPNTEPRLRRSGPQVAQGRTSPCCGNIRSETARCRARLLA